MIELVLVKTNVPGLSKDKKTKTIINNSTSDYVRVLENRKKAKDIIMMAQDIERLKVGLQELNQKVSKLLNE
jgi:hypothetical protein